MLLNNLTIIGHSMEPTIHDGEKVLASSIPYLFSKPKVGDVVAFKKEGKIFIKRIVKINQEKYFVKGDNKKDSMDSRKLGWIEKGEIVGKMIYQIRIPKHEIRNNTKLQMTKTFWI